MASTLSALYQATMDLELMLRQCDVARKGLEAELASLHELMDEHEQVMNEHELDAYLGNINDYYIETAETLPRLQWYSQLLVSYSFFEKALDDACGTLRIEQGLALSLKDLYGKGITRARNYLVKVAGVTDPFDGVTWQELEGISELRNVIAHRRGYVGYEPSNPKSLYSRLASIPGVELSHEALDEPEAQVVFGYDFVTSAITSFAQFTRQLAAAIQARANRTRDPAKYTSPMD